MTRAVFMLLLGLLTAVTGATQPVVKEPENDRAAIVQTALDYAEGYYGGEPARMTRAVSPYLSKRGLLAPPNRAPLLVEMNADMLIEASNGAKLAPAERHITTEVFAVDGDTASARVFTAHFNDYLHLVKRGGTWQILNVLWHPPPSPAAAAGAGADEVANAAKEYAAALFAADAQRTIAVLHPLAHLRMLAPPREGRARIVAEQTPDTLAAGLAAGQVKLPGGLENIQLTVDGVDGDIASARLKFGPMPAYLHLARQEGRWRVVNTLMSPPAPGS